MRMNLLYICLLVFFVYGHKTMSQNNTLKKDSIKEKTNFREFKDKTIFEDDTSNGEDDTLNGKIKTIIQNTYGENFDSSDVIYTFDEFGFKVRRQGYGQDIFEYYENNKIIKTSICDADNGKEYRRNEYLYNERGNLIKRINNVDLPKDKYTQIIHYFYSNDDKVIEIRDLIETIKYKYDELNDCIIEERYNNEDVLRERMENKYINHRIAEKVTWRLFEGEEYYVKEIYNYNLNGTLKSIIYYYSYTKEFPKKPSVIRYFYYTYDKENRLVKYKLRDDNYKETIIYSNFDKNGNWQLKKINQNGRKKKIKRRFEYYDN